jgi:hypothetical protein
VACVSVTNARRSEVAFWSSRSCFTFVVASACAVNITWVYCRLGLLLIVGAVVMASTRGRGHQKDMYATLFGETILCGPLVLDPIRGAASLSGNLSYLENRFLTSLPLEASRRDVSRRFHCSPPCIASARWSLG